MGTTNSDKFLEHLIAANAAGGLQIDTGLTDEESNELNQLESELRNWKHNKQLDKFKQLPAKLRQEIVDEALLKDLVSDYNHDRINVSEFDSYKRMLELRSKRHNPWADVNINHSYNDFNQNYYHWKYDSIFKQFTTEELVAAHTEVTLEEELSD